jgi:transcriptional regulator with XRE-family HTH domain
MGMVEHENHQEFEWDWTLEKVGERIKQARKRKKITMSELADRSGLSTSAISRYERGERKPTFDALSALADALDVSAEYLYGVEDIDTQEFARKAKHAFENLDGEELASAMGLPENSIPLLLPRELHVENMKTEDEYISAMIAYCDTHPDYAAKYLKSMAAINPADKVVEHLKAKAQDGAPFVKQSPVQMHHAGILKFNSESDRITYFYGLLNTDGKLVAARGMFNNLDESKLTEVADYIEKLADTPQYQNVPAADDTNH